MAITLLLFNTNPNTYNNEGYTPLHVAIINQQIEAVQFAINYNE